MAIQLFLEYFQKGETREFFKAAHCILGEFSFLRTFF